MKYDESLEDFMDNFLHLCYEFSKEDVDWDFMSEKFQSLDLVSLKPFASNYIDDFSLANSVNNISFLPS